MEAQRAVAMASTALGRDDALERCHDALTAAYDLRHWLWLWYILRSIALSLAERGRLEPAAMLLAASQRRTPAFGYEYYIGFEARTLELLDADEGAEAWMRRGAAMDRHEIAEYAFAQLAR